MVTGVQADWGLVEMGVYQPTGSSGTVEFTQDGETWETMTTKVPG